MFKKHPAGLYVLGLANTGERFGYYTMLAILLLFLQAKFGFSAAVSGQIYAIFLALVYFMPLLGGFVADKWSFSKCVICGIFVMFVGYGLIAIPTPIGASSSLLVLLIGLALVAIGTGLFKGNLQVMVGDLYKNPKYKAETDSGFSLFYMFINLGSMVAPFVATVMVNAALHSGGFEFIPDMATLCNNFMENGTDANEIIALATAHNFAIGTDVAAFANAYVTKLSLGYGLAFAVACASLVLSFLIYTLGKSTFSHIITDKKEQVAQNASKENVKELSPEQTKQRVVALLLVFAVVIFFWMVFHQNGATLTEFAKSCTATVSSGFTRIGFNVGALLTIVVAVWSIFIFFQSGSKGKIFSAIFFCLAAAGVALFYVFTPSEVTGLQPQQYQQFNPFYVVALTPVSLALFGWLARKKKEPSAPRKIGYGMLMAGVAYLVMVFGSLTLTGTQGAVSPNWLISTYLLLTFAELLLSPMGISFVSKVAPPKLKGSMMGGWFAATAIGNYLVSIPMLLWGHIPVWVIWTILIGLCLASAAFIFSIMKKLEAATEDTPVVNAEDIENVEADAI